MTISISRELPLFNFERLNILCAWIGHPSGKLLPFQFLESFCCSISNVSIYDAPESDLRVKSYDHLNFSRSSVVQFRASKYMMCLNRTSEWKVMTTLISQELPWFNFGRLHMWCAWIRYSSGKFWQFQFVESFHCAISSVSIYDAPESELRVKSYDHLNFSRSSVVQFRASPYVMCLNRTSVWKVMTIWISREVSFYYFERFDMWCSWIGPPCDNLWPFEFLESFHCSISSISIYDVPESDIRVKSYDNFNFSRAYVVQFRASPYLICLNRTSEWKVMTILNSRELPLFNFECLDIWCAWIGPLCEKLW